MARVPITVAVMIVSSFMTHRVRGGSLVGHWTMDDNAANAAVVDSAGSKNGILYSGFGLTENTDLHHRPDCREGWGALAFDGTNDYVEITGYKGITGTASRTCTTWIKSQPQRITMEILCWGGNAAGGEKWTIRVSETGTLRAEVSGGYIIGTTPINDGSWHHIAVVLYDDGSADIAEAQLYVDGQLETNVVKDDQSINTASAQDVSIGVYLSGTRFFAGLIDDVRIYDYALSAQEIYHIGYPAHAWAPSPGDGEFNLGLDSSLSWSAGENSPVSHDVYFGTSESAVTNARRFAGDIDGDGSVDTTDLSIFAGQWLTDPGGVNQSADRDCSGTVDFSDFAAVANDWQKAPDPNYVGNRTDPDYNPGTLSANTDYFWRVDELNACGQFSPSKGKTWSFSTKVATGRHVFKEPTTGRCYVLYVPTDYAGSTAYPLIVSSHGTSQNGDTEMDSTGSNNCCDYGTPTWPALAEAYDVIVACPDMTGAYGYGGQPCDSVSLSPARFVEWANDETAILGIVSDLKGIYNIDSTRIMLTGFSGGGNVVHYVGLRHPELFTAICARHGNFVPELAPDPLPGGIKNIPVYLFTGSQDASCGTTNSAGSINWYTAEGFNHLHTEIFTTYPSYQHTTDRHHGLNWFLGL